MTDDTNHGQTYGEAVVECLEEIIETCEELESEADRLRAEGAETEAELLQRMSDLLAKEGLELAEKRRKMPFGIDSAQGFGETMDNPMLSLLEKAQREESTEDE